MSHEVFFIGLGQIGTSIAMNFARSESEIQLVGYDPVKEHTRRAKELGIFDSLVSNPKKASKSAEIVVLDLPPSAIHDQLEMLGKQLKPDGIIIDTSPAHSLAIQWAREHLPADRHYLGVTPIIGAHVLLGEGEEKHQPRIDLFQNSLLAIVVPTRGSEVAVDTGLDLARLLGATPIFIDPDEHDGITTSVEWLPRLISAAILQTASKAGNWQDMQRMAGMTFASITALCSEPPANDPGDLSALNREILRGKLTHFIAELQNLLHVLSDESGKSLNEYIASANAARNQWLTSRQQGAQTGKSAYAERVPQRRSTIDKLLGFHPSEDRH
jgi:prephenate dehydrogenase